MAEDRVSGGGEAPAGTPAADAGIEALRQRIDAIDRQLVQLLNERADCAREVGRRKESQGQPIYQPAREAEVLAHVRAINRGPLDDDAVTRLFERIIDEARRLERLASRHDDLA